MSDEEKEVDAESEEENTPESGWVGSHPERKTKYFPEKIYLFKNRHNLYQKKNLDQSSDCFNCIVH